MNKYLVASGLTALLLCGATTGVVFSAPHAVTPSTALDASVHGSLAQRINGDVLAALIEAMHADPNVAKMRGEVRVLVSAHGANFQVLDGRKRVLVYAVRSGPYAGDYVVGLTHHHSKAYKEMRAGCVGSDGGYSGAFITNVESGNTTMRC